ncbi:LAME_0H20120g1_1 [Lachancea meyersii CBS 8951]|uniref:LAME_0H20120g1_1 n=1 Tax=Lachancea meyersii CBS 8951 TaxID=1266667 RepID=A0A1G4KJP2_9SACH|nr:LAME_0H20120g1_1 [Lachancea meyersii CBS 8951]
MGVPAFWELIKTDGSVHRVPFRKFIVDFKASNGRSPRLAIDAFGWLFECGYYASTTDKESPGKAYRGEALAIIALFKRLNTLLSLDVTFILVFDGPLKPEFKKRAKLKKALDFETDDEESTEPLESAQQTVLSYQECLSVDNNSSFSNDLNAVKQLLRAMNISWIDASGEGEAECARLQECNSVDYVVSNDSDVFIFGATKVLRNLSKFWEDLPASYAGSLKKKDHKETFITILDMSEFQNWNRDQIILFYAFLGADYSQGVRGLGPKKSATLALLQNPNFASQFTNIFADPTLNVSSRRQQYLAFQDHVFKYSQANSTELFGRNYFKSSAIKKFQGWPSEDALMHYFHPIMSPVIDASKLTGEFINISGNLSVNERNFQDMFVLLNGLNMKSIPNTRNWFHETTHKALTLKMLLQGAQSHELVQTMKITDEWVAECCQGQFRLECWRVRYNTFLPGVEEPLPEDQDDMESTKGLATASRRGSPTKKQLDRAAYKYMTSVPKSLVPASHPLVLEFYSENSKERDKSSPRKRTQRRHTAQKNNLDDFLKNHTSPRKLQQEPSKSMEMPPTKRKLFVDDELDFTDSDNAEWVDTSSLILMSEHACEEAGPLASPKRNLLLDYDHCDRSSNDKEIKESPLKKQNTSGSTKHLTKNPMISKQHIDLTIDSDA